jgi:TolB-like protein
MGAVLAALAILWTSAALAGTNVAVFNFQMKSDTPEWRWLEKGLADRIATDFVRAPGLAVVARDEMQLVAQKMNWVPEMATTDAARMGEIQKSLEIEQLISGVYSVSDGRIRITGQIVDVESRMELARKEVEGPAETVLDLQRQLSAELLGWFTKKPPAEILETLPVWTRNLPAMRALYEGMDLYDQGRYGEGWLKFRQASREDSGYVEAQYWVGKMYYFMNRYKHARRAMERFVYLDAFHPRVGDAVREFLHTYEDLEAPAETLLELYSKFIERYPNEVFPDGASVVGWVHGGAWLREKSARLLEQIGRYRDATLVSAGPGVDRWPGDERAGFSLPVYNALTGNTFAPGELPYLRYIRSLDEVVYFAQGPMTREGVWNKPPLGGPGFKPTYYVYSRSYLFLAPSGHVFKSIRLFPLSKETEGVVDFRLAKDLSGNLATWRGPLSSVLEKGLLFENLPPTGVLEVECTVRSEKGVKRTPDDPEAFMNLISGLRGEVRFEKLGPHGAIEVCCATGVDFRVDVDGRVGRVGPGLIGLLEPGEHTLKFYPTEARGPYGEWSTKVLVEAGKVTHITARLPWEKGPWVSWTNNLFVGQDYPGYYLCPLETYDAPTLQVDDEAIRVVWCRGGDIWSSVSTDGQTFSPPRKLGLPVSSGWTEENVRVLRDESGRFLIVFASDRGGQHKMRPYVSWSRDFAHWTAPAAISDELLEYHYAITQDAGGRFILVKSRWWPERALRIYTSRDAYIWQELPRVSVPLELPGGCVECLHILQLSDGSYELYFATRKWTSAFGIGEPFMRVWRLVSHDLRNWSGPEEVVGLPHHPSSHGRGNHNLCVVEDNRGVLLTVFLNPAWSDSLYRNTTTQEPYSNDPPWGPGTVMFRETAAGKWGSSLIAGRPLDGLPTMAYHPRWGYIIAWNIPATDIRGFAREKAGPFLIRGPNVEPFFEKQPEQEGR